MSGYWDFSDSAVSIINAASVRELGKTIKKDLDIRRFRGNLIVDDIPPWEELAWPGQRLRVSEVKFEVLQPAMRCPATSVNPQTGYRDLTVPEDMQEALDHLACGIYARVVKSGTIEKGDLVKTIGEGEFPLDDALRGGGPDYRLWPKPAMIEIAEGTAEKRNL